MSLSSRTQRLLESARREVQPSPDDLRRVRARLTSSLASGLADGSSKTLLPLLFFSLATVAVGLSAWRLATSRPLVAPRPPPTAPPVTAVVAPVSSCPAAPECPAAPVCSPAPPPRTRQCTPTHTPERQPSPLSAQGLRSLTFSVPAEASARSGLEVGLLIDARVALDEGRSLDALGHVSRHKELFPASPFEEERLAIEVVAKCQARRPELARDAFKRLLERAPLTTYLARILDACGAGFEQPESETDDE